MEEKDKIVDTEQQIATDPQAPAEEKSEEQLKKERAEYIKSETISWIKTIVGAVLCALFLVNFVIVNAKVPTGSMKNTIMENDRLIASRLSYKFHDPERYDIVVFKYPDDESLLYVKRIIGMPGETVDIIDGKVYIDGSDVPLKDDFIREEMFPFQDLHYEVPEGCYFMLGDNRNESKDSRYWNDKFVKGEKILGKAIFKYYPAIESLTQK